MLPCSSENAVVGGADASTQQQARKWRVPSEALPDLIRLIHGNTNGCGFLIKEFMTFWSKKNKTGEEKISKASLLKKIREIGRWMACPEEGPMHLKACWYVPEDIRKEHLPDEKLGTPNTWKYNLTPKRKSDVMNVTDKSEKDEEKEKDKEKEKKNVPLITQFTKKISQDEMKKQLAAKSPSVTSKPIQQRQPKRATLISVGRNEQFSKSQTSLLTKFINSDRKSTESSGNVDHDTDDIIILDDIEDDKTKSEKNTENETKSEKNPGDEMKSNENTEDETKSEKNAKDASKSEKNIVRDEDSVEDSDKRSLDLNKKDFVAECMNVDKVKETNKEKRSKGQIKKTKKSPAKQSPKHTKVKSKPSS